MAQIGAKWITVEKSCKIQIRELHIFQAIAVCIIYASQRCIDARDAIEEMRNEGTRVD